MMTLDLILSICTGFGLLAGILYLREKGHSNHLQTELTKHKTQSTMLKRKMRHC